MNFIVVELGFFCNFAAALVRDAALAVSRLKGNQVQVLNSPATVSPIQPTRPLATGAHGAGKADGKGDKSGDLPWRFSFQQSRGLDFEITSSVGDDSRFLGERNPIPLI